MRVLCLSSWDAPEVTKAEATKSMNWLSCICNSACGSNSRLPNWIIAPHWENKSLRSEHDSRRSPQKAARGFKVSNEAARFVLSFSSSCWLLLCWFLRLRLSSFAESRKASLIQTSSCRLMTMLNAATIRWINCVTERVTVSVVNALRRARSENFNCSVLCPLVNRPSRPDCTTRELWSLKFWMHNRREI